MGIDGHRLLVTVGVGDDLETVSPGDRGVVANHVHALFLQEMDEGLTGSARSRCHRRAGDGAGQRNDGGPDDGCPADERTDVHAIPSVGVWHPLSVIRIAGSLRRLPGGGRSATPPECQTPSS